MQVFEARRAADIAEAFYALDRSRFQGLLLLSSPLIGGNPQLIADLAIRRNLPTISPLPEIARAGGLIGYGPVIQDLFRQVGGMARKILQGANVTELPVERPTRFQLVANLKTAKLIGITLPASIRTKFCMRGMGPTVPGEERRAQPYLTVSPTFPT